MKYVPGSKDLILEVGSGSNPWTRSDVLLDRFYVDETGQRGKGDLFVDSRPMLVAAGERLPFKDKVFDYVYCNHVIEHAEDLVSMLKEMSRVGKKGFIECPNPVLERILNEKHHNWYVSNVEETLMIVRKTPENNITTEVDKFYFHMMGDHFIVRQYWDHFVTRLEWSGEIRFELLENVDTLLAKYQIEDGLKEKVNIKLERVLRKAWKDAVKVKIKRKIQKLPFGNIATGLARKIRKIKTSKVQVRFDKKDLLDILACPYCHQELTRLDSRYRCGGCGREYQIKDSIPVFL